MDVISKAAAKMAVFYDGAIHDIRHFLKVWSYARVIGGQEHLDETTQVTLELAAIVHDIACPLCRELYGAAVGVKQEQHGVSLAREFFADIPLSSEVQERVIFLVGHHHTLNGVDGVDYQILLEADFLVNAEESGLSREKILSFREKVFRTQAGIVLLNSIYRLTE